MPHIRDLFFCASLIAVGKRKSYPMVVEQVVQTEGDRKRIAEQKKKALAGKRRSAEGRCLVRGRKQGSKNRPKQPNPTASFRAFTALLNKLLSCLPGINLTYMVADCAYASADYFSAVTKTGLHLITRLPVNAALVYAYSDPVAPKHRGRPKKYGEKVDLNNLDNQELKDTKTENGLLTQIWQLPCYNKSLSKNLLNVGIVKITNLKTQKVAFSKFCTTDPNLDWQTMIDYYSLRFQIEFDFRDAKQFFGLSDFKNYTSKNLTNFVNLCFTATLTAKILQAQYQVKYNNPNFSILDLKILCNTRFTVKTVIKLVRKSPDSIFNTQFADGFMPTDLVNVA
ncbi:MAG: transposase [Sphingobacteriales bacterium]|nr:MAG: transposase [Sphingobacteriales bacterium]